MEYSIRFATKADTERIMNYIDTYWKKGHILSRDRDLFDWQYGNEGEKLNIVLGIDEANDIQGMLGFVPYDHGDNKDIALALWKANPSTGFLGIKLLKFLLENEPHRGVVCPGINMDTTSKIYEYMGMRVGCMSQWYRLRKKDSYIIAKVVDNTIPKHSSTRGRGRLIKLESEVDFERNFNFDCNEYAKSVPYKSLTYITKRYYYHPTYKYLLYGLMNDENIADVVFVFRVQEHNGARALRLIDCIGDTERIGAITPEIDKLMEQYDCEYTDAYETGIDDEIFLSAGWKKVENEGNIIPDYFSPFEHRKVDIFYAASELETILFKGDGDQDRPNLLGKAN